MDQELIHCFTDAYGQCICCYEAWLEDEPGLVEFVLGAFLPFALTTIFGLYWLFNFGSVVEAVTEVLAAVGLVPEPAPEDPDQYLDGLERLFQTQEERALMVSQMGPHDLDGLDLCADMIWADIIRARSSWHEMSRADSSPSISGLVCPVRPTRDLGAFVGQRIAWLMNLEASNRQQLAPSTVLIEEVNEEEEVRGQEQPEVSGDGEEELSLEEPAKGGFDSADSDSDVGDFCVIPKEPSC